MKCVYPLNQPNYALLGDLFKAYFYGHKGIVKFYTFKVSPLESFTVSIIPDGVVDIIFIKEKNGNRRICTFGTPATTRCMFNNLNVQSGDILFGVQFLPNVLPALTGIAASELIGEIIEIENFAPFQFLTDILFETESFYEQIQIFLKHYLEYYENTYKLRISSSSCIAAYMLSEIVKSQGTVKLNKLSEDACYTARYMNKMFNAEFGMSPKSYERLIRFQYMLNGLLKEQRIIDISEDMDMYEGNFIREFKAITGETPRGYRELLTEYKKHIVIL